MTATKFTIFFLLCFNILEGFVPENVSVNKLDMILDHKNDDIVNKITSGYKANKGQFPYQVALVLFSSGFPFCGGTLINARYVVTAAHCLKNLKPNQLLVKLGIVDVYDNAAVKRGVSKFIIHSQYRYGYPDNDIALLQMSRTVQLNSDVNVLTLPHPSSSSYGKCRISGWGKQGPFLPQSSHLLFATVNKFNDRRCKILYNYIGISITSKMLCYGGGKEDTCKGDSGSPVTCFTRTRRPFLAGITSFGVPNCGSNNFPSVYVNVQKYVSWIRKATT